MERWICLTCGTQFAQSEEPPSICPICSDDRQYVRPEGQQWTTLAAMREQGYKNLIKEEEPSLIGIGTEPSFAIGQRALLVQTPQGNVLWDCITYLDNEVVEAVQKLGGIHAISISHPHYYSCMNEWAERFNAPIYLHEADRQWVMRPSEYIKFWSGETLRLLEGVTVIRLGGHFPGSTVLHWPAGAEGKGVLLTGDTIYPVAHQGWVSFMYSYPNSLPLPASEIRRIRAAIEPYHYDRLYGAWFNRMIAANARESVLTSADRYIKHII